ncbi:hypothetical protein KA183_09105 [bacterium]|nr:hypothetical protein [bacterium]QQR56804.1 MAG: hypothetical protein IPG59_17660 [Candidatus Melainabacteria bacterium]
MKIVVFATCLLFVLAGCTTRTEENLSSKNHWTLQHRTKDLMVQIAIEPATPDHNSVFITLQNNRGEPISSAKVLINTVKQWMFSKQRNLEAKYVAAGTYRVDTNMESGISEMNISIKPPDRPTTKLRIEVDIDKILEPKKPYLLL